MEESGRNQLKPAPREDNRVVKWSEGVGENKRNGWYTDDDFISYKDQETIFLFGENFLDNYINKEGRKNNGGQAAVAGKYDWRNNERFRAYGITTISYYDGYDIGDLENYKKLIDKEFSVLEKFVMYGGKVIIPYTNDGKVNLGNGIASLDKQYPDHYKYL